MRYTKLGTTGLDVSPIAIGAMTYGEPDRGHPVWSLGEEQGFVRVHYDRKKGRVLGGTIVARHAGEMIGELTLAMTHGLKVSAFSSTIHPYPTQAEALKRVGDEYMRGSLTPFVQRLFRSWFAWRR